MCVAPRPSWREGLGSAVKEGACSTMPPIVSDRRLARLGPEEPDGCSLERPQDRGLPPFTRSEKLLWSHGGGSGDWVVVTDYGSSLEGSAMRFRETGSSSNT